MDFKSNTTELRTMELPGIEELRADRLEQALRELALTANNLLRLTISEPISDTNAWRALSGAVTRALECANAK